MDFRNKYKMWHWLPVIMKHVELLMTETLKSCNLLYWSVDNELQQNI